jgi:hypothetical protein
MIDWNAWSRIVDAAQDPQHRDAVQSFLAQAELSAEIPPALDEKLLAPRRSAGASGEECAYLLCNLGFAALVAGTSESADFAAGCGRLVEQLAPESPDLALRRHFLLSKSALMVAVLTGQPHLLWDKAAGRCVAYLQSIDQHLEQQPGEVIESNAMAAYSFSGQLLSRLKEYRAVANYASEISQLVVVALELERRLPAAFVARLWNSVIPGADAAVLFRQAGAEAELAMQLREGSQDHARKGIAYADEILLRSRDKAVPDLGRTLQIRVELLLLSGKFTEAMEQADALENLPDQAGVTQAIVLRAKHHLQQGDPESAAAILGEIAPTADQALENWRASWMGSGGDGNWVQHTEGSRSPENDQEIGRLQAVAAADQGDMQGFLSAAERSAGFDLGPILKEGQKWADVAQVTTGDRWTEPDPSSTQAEVANVEPNAALDDIYARLDDGTVLLQIIRTEAGFLTWIARKQDEGISQFIAPERPNPNRLIEAHNTWSRAYFDTQRPEADRASVFSRFVDEVSQNWGDLLQGLMDDGASQLILIGDDLVDIPLHAARTGSGDERLIDRMPVTYAPSLLVLRACIARTPVQADRRRGLELRSLTEAESDSARALAGTLETKLRRMAPPIDASFLADAAAAQVLHIVARASQNARLPLDSLLGAGWLDLSFAQLAAELNLRQCEVVANLACESALPSMLRAPGFDLSSVFLAGGARSVLASTWLARDELAAELVQLFFRLWVTGQAPSAAFREALLEVRSGQPSLKDFEWAGMRLVGAP